MTTPTADPNVTVPSPTPPNSLPYFPLTVRTKSGVSAETALHFRSVNGEDRQESGEYGLRTAPTPALDRNTLPLGAEALAKPTRAARVLANREATAELQATTPDLDVLRRYSGGGGLGESIDEFYTPLIAAEAMVRAAGHWAEFTTVLDPACGTGGLLSRTPATSLRVGIELNSTSAAIARHLMPGAAIVNTTAERYFTTSPDALFDVALVNPPFGYRLLRHLDQPDVEKNEYYFTLNALDRVKHGTGVAVLLIPAALTTDRAHQKWREEMSARGEVAYHAVLPNSTFATAGASVMTVILTFVRHDVGVYEALNVLSREQRSRLLQQGVSRHFISGERVLYTGQDYRTKQPTTVLSDSRDVAVLSDEKRFGTGRYGEPTLLGRLTASKQLLSEIAEEASSNIRRSSRTLSEVLAAISATYGDSLMRQAAAAAKLATLHPLPPGMKSRDGRFIMTLDGWKPTDDFSRPEVTEALQIGTVIGRAKQAESDGKPSWALWRMAVSQDEAYRQRYGGYDLPRLKHLAGRFGVIALLLAHLTDTGLKTSDDQQEIPKLTGTPEEIAGHLADLFALTEEELVRQTGLSDAQAEQILQANFCFTGEQWIHPDMYYVGNAITRSEQARLHSQAFTGTRRAALMRQSEEFMRRMTPVSLAELKVSPRDPVVPLPALEAFVNKFLGTVRNDGRHVITVDREHGAVKFIFARTGHETRYDDPRKNVDETAIKHLHQYLNHNTHVPQVRGANTMTPEEYQAERTVNLEEARAYEESIYLAFASWLPSSGYADTVLDAYNRAHRAHIVPAGLAAPLKLEDWKGPAMHPYQNLGVRRMATVSGMINGDDVGLGKTYQCLLLICYLKHIGQATRPIVVVPAGLIGNWASSARRALPSWNVLTIGMSPRTDKGGLPVYKKLRSGAIMFDTHGEPVMQWREDTAEKRRLKLAELAAGMADLVIMSRDTFTAIPMSDQNREQLIMTDLQYLSRLESSETFDRTNKRARHSTLARIQRFHGQCNARLRAASATDLLFEHLGVDLLAFDEAHAYKALYAPPTTFGETPKFLGAGQESNRALDAVHKARYVRRHGGRTYAFTASWVKNSPIEIHSMTSLISDDLPMYGLATVENLMEHFIDVQPRIITTLDGDVRVQPAVVGFTHLVDLKQMIDTKVIARKAGDEGVIQADGKPLHVPRIVEVEIPIDMSAEQQEHYATLRQEALMSSSRSSEQDKLHTFSVMWRMRKLTADPAMLGVGGPNPRFEEIARQALRVRASGGKALVFLSIGEKEGSFDRLRDTLIQAGYPEHEIAVVTGKTHTNSVQRQDLEDQYNHGDLSLILGTDLLAEGFNLQIGTKAIIHGDIPWNWEGIRQRNGRGGRQGNKYDEVESLFILMRGSFDMITYTIMRGKRAWQDQIDGTTDETANTAAELGLEQLALMLSDDPERTRQRIADKKDELAEISEGVARKRKMRQVMQTTNVRNSLKFVISAANGRKNGWTQLDYVRVKQTKQALEREMARTPSVEDFPLAQLVTYTGRLHWAADLPFHKGMTFTIDDAPLVVTDVTLNDVTAFDQKAGKSRTFTFRELARLAQNIMPDPDPDHYDSDHVLSGMKLAQVIMPDNVPLHAMMGRKTTLAPKAANVLSVSVKGTHVQTIPSRNASTLLKHIQDGDTIIHYLTRDDLGGVVIEQVVILCPSQQNLDRTKSTLESAKPALLKHLKTIAETALAS